MAQVGGTTSVAVLKGVGVRPFILGAVGSLSVALAAASAVCFLNPPLLPKPRLLALVCWVRDLYAGRAISGFELCKLQSSLGEGDLPRELTGGKVHYHPPLPSECTQ